MHWPRPNEELFKSAEDWHLNACVGYSRDSLSSYADNYRAGADALIRSATDGNAVLDAVIYPIVFLYRHYIELCLKDIVFLGRRLQDDSRPFPKVHNLSALWVEAKQLLVTHYGNDVPPGLQNLNGIIDEFTQHDPNSQAFRYPWDRKGNPHLQEIQHINIRNLQETMDRVASFLGCMAGDLSAILDARSA